MSARKRFRELHTSGFLLPNPWDIGSARRLASLGFEAGVKRISTGSVLSLVAQSARVEAGCELQGQGTHAFWSRALQGAGAVQTAFGPYGADSD